MESLLFYVEKVKVIFLIYSNGIFFSVYYLLIQVTWIILLETFQTIALGIALYPECRTSPIPLEQKLEQLFLGVKVISSELHKIKPFVSKLLL